MHSTPPSRALQGVQILPPCLRLPPGTADGTLSWPDLRQEFRIFCPGWLLPHPLASHRCSLHSMKFLKMDMFSWRFSLSDGA